MDNALEASNYSQKPYVFLDEFCFLLSLATTTPNEFVLVGDFNVHVDTTSDTLPSRFLSLLSSVNLVQHANFPTHIENHTLDLLITSAASLLSLKTVLSNLFDPADSTRHNHEGAGRTSKFKSND